MESNRAADHLQTIRTLMERAAVYRRALAPVMLFAGALGTVAAAIGFWFELDSMPAFSGLWLGTAGVTVTGALLITRRQAIHDREPFWSPPTRRVTLAFVPPLLAGLCMGAVLLIVFGDGIELIVSLVWILFYGCALHAAGFFMPRGIKLFGWLFIAAACALFGAVMFHQVRIENAHLVMGLFFGLLHLAYGAYLYLTEKGMNAA